MNFIVFTTSELKAYLQSFRLTRSITKLHVHHTWKPEHKDYKGSNGIELQKGMRNYHVKVNGWKDIAQHLTLLPDGRWVLGRDFNEMPASILGFNEGAFSVEMLGNFDVGFDKFKEPQSEAMFDFCAFFVTLKTLDLSQAIVFHRDSPTAGKTCPGSGIDKAWFMGEVQKKLESKPKIEEWKYKAIEELALAGLIHKPDTWKAKIDEAMPTWAVLAVINNLYQQFLERSEK